MSFLKNLWEVWKRIAHRIARFNAMVLCTLLYFILIPLVAVPFRLRKDPLRLSGSAEFLPRDPRDQTLEETAKQG